MTLDTRHASREGKLPVAICFHQQGKKWYYHLDMKLTGDEFVNVCKATGRGRVPTNFVGDRPYDIKLKLEAEFDKYYSMVESLSRSKRLTIPAIKTMITGVGMISVSLKSGMLNVRRNPWVQQRITEVPRIHLSSISER